MDEPIRETSPGAAKRLELSFRYINPRNAGIASLDNIPRKDVVLIRISRHHTDSARFFRISEIRANQQDSSESARLTESARLQESDRYPPTASHERVIVLHSPPQLEDLSLVGVSSSRGSLDLFGFVGFLRTGQGPFYTCYSLVILCPFCGLLVYGHRPFDLAHGLFSLCLRALSSYAYGPFFLMPTGPLFIPAGPCPNCYLVD